MQYHTIPACKLGAIFHNPSLRYDKDCYVIRNAVYITIIKDALQSSTIICICYLTPWLTWLASVATHKLRFHASHTQTIIESCSILDNHGTSQPLPWCRQWEPFIFTKPGSAYNNFHPAAFAQRTGKAVFLGLTQPRLKCRYHTPKTGQPHAAYPAYTKMSPADFPPGMEKGRRIWGISCLTDIVPYPIPIVNSGLCSQIHFFHVRLR